jgi:hypothetical protein
MDPIIYDLQDVQERLADLRAALTLVAQGGHIRKDDGFRPSTVMRAEDEFRSRIRSLEALEEALQLGEDNPYATLFKKLARVGVHAENEAEKVFPARDRGSLLLAKLKMSPDTYRSAGGWSVFD